MNTFFEIIGWTVIFVGVMVCTLDIFWNLYIIFEMSLK